MPVPLAKRGHRPLVFVGCSRASDAKPSPFTYSSLSTLGPPTSGDDEPASSRHNTGGVLLCFLAWRCPSLQRGANLAGNQYTLDDNGLRQPSASASARERSKGDRHPAQTCRGMTAICNRLGAWRTRLSRPSDADNSSRFEATHCPYA